MPDNKDSKKDSRVLIIVALIGLTGTISAALIANFDKLFRHNQADQQVASATMSPAPGAPSSTSSPSLSLTSGATSSPTSTPSPTEYQKQSEQTTTSTTTPESRPVFSKPKSRPVVSIPESSSILTGESTPDRPSGQLLTSLPAATDPKVLDAGHTFPAEEDRLRSGRREQWKQQLSSYKNWYDLRLSNPKAAYAAGQSYLRLATSDDGKEDVRRYIRAYEQALKQ